MKLKFKDGFEGVRIEVIEGSNTRLEYTVLSHFNR